MPDDDADTERRPSVAARILHHPLRSVAVISGLVAVGHAVWIWNHRRLGGLDPDESGYIATAFEYHRTFSVLHPYDFVHAVGATGFAPLVPLMSMPLLWLGPHDPRTAMMLLPILLVVGSVFVAGIAHRVASPGAAIAAGFTFSVIPTVNAAAQSYWLGLGAATAFAGSVWALLASDRCRNRITWLFGLGLAAMLLSRTMALGFVPGALLAAAVVTRWDRPSLTRLAQSLGITAVVAGPWWIVEWSTIFGYLNSYGYGERAGLFGGGGPLERLGFRVDRVSDAIGSNITWTALVVAVITAVVAVRRQQGRPVMTDRWRYGLALVIVVTIGLAALVSTSNNGVWFELPIVAVVLPLGAMVVDRAPRALQAVVVVPIVGMALVQTPVSWWWLDPDTDGVPWLAENHLYATQYEPAFAEYDLRMSTARRGEEIGASREWWALTTEVGDIVTGIERDSDGPVEFWLSGNMELFNTNTVYLDMQLRRRSTAFHIPDTTLTDAERRRDLTPDETDRDGRRAERILIVALHDQILFTPDRDVADFARQARASGWDVTERVPMPDGGEVQVMRHEDA